jgi:hypothetical protein
LPSPTAEHINDEIDETNLFVFALEWLFVPSLPVFQVLYKSSDAHSYIDDVALFITGIDILVYVAKMYFLLTDTSGRFIQNFARDFIMRPFLGAGLAFAIAVLNYYVLWWIVPNFLSSFVFYMFVYVFVPFFAIRSALACFGLVGKEGSIFEFIEDLKAGFITKYRKSD